MVLLGRRVGRVVLSSKRYIAIIARMYVIAVTICVWTTYTILPTCVKGLNVAVGDYRHNLNGVRNTNGYATRYETTEGDVGSRI